MCIITLKTASSFTEFLSPTVLLPFYVKSFEGQLVVISTDVKKFVVVKVLLGACISPACHRAKLNRVETTTPNRG